MSGANNAEIRFNYDNSEDPDLFMSIFGGPGAILDLAFDFYEDCKDAWNEIDPDYAVRRYVPVVF